jgi:ABC-3C biological conflict system middle component
MMLKPWESRAPEEANLFNPAFLGSLIYEFTKEHKKHKSESAPIEFIPLFLAIVLHAPTRKRLPYSTVTSLYEWLQDNEDSKIGFVKRVQGILPYAREALRFSMSKNTLAIGHGHGIDLSDVSAHFPASFVRETSSETKEIIDRTKFMARWFAKSGSEVSIIGAWGISL